MAFVRPVAHNFSKAILAPGVSQDDVDLDLARHQHREYVNVLQSLVLTYFLPPAPTLPDSVFVEDTGISYNGKVLLPRPGAESREGESEGVESMFKDYEIETKRVSERLDGGDVLITPKHVFVGRSERSGSGAKGALEEFTGREVIEVDVQGALHLKSLVTWIDIFDSEKGFLIAANEDIVAKLEDATNNTGYYSHEAVCLDPEEAYAANTLTQGGYTMMASGYPKAIQKVKERGVDVLEVDVSEFKKAQGSLTCLSLIVQV